MIITIIVMMSDFGGVKAAFIQHINRINNNGVGWFTSSSSLFASTLEGRKIEGVLNPTNNFVLVKTAAKQDKIEGTDILLSKSAKIKKYEGTVVSTGPGKSHPESGILYPMPVEPGEGVVYGKYDGIEVEYNGETHTLIRDTDILVKFRAGESLSIDSVDTVNDYVLVKVELNENETSGGLLLAAPSSESEKRPSTGTVVKVGPGKMDSQGSLMKMDVQEG